MTSVEGATAEEQVYLEYVKRWTERGRKTSPLTKEQVLRCLADLPFQDPIGKQSIRELLEMD